MTRSQRMSRTSRDALRCHMCSVTHGGAASMAARPPRVCLSRGGLPLEKRVPSPPMYTETFAQFKKQLGQLNNWLGMATEYAKSKNFDPDVFVTLRLAPDQFPLSRQVQIACDTVKLAAGYLTGKPMP